MRYAVNKGKYERYWIAAVEGADPEETSSADAAATSEAQETEQEIIEKPLGSGGCI